MLTVSTDAVFSGTRGPYLESDHPDPSDLYGITKWLGEVRSDRAMHLRTSVVGFERRPGVSLLAWFLQRPEGDRVPGYVNHLWNGITTLHLARLVCGIVREGAFAPGIHHVVPADEVSKAALLELFAHAFDRSVTVVPQRSPSNIDRRLGTTDPAANQARWAAAGYAAPPGIRTMVTELAAYALAAGLKPP